MRKKRILTLVNLYLRYALQKVTIIILCISLILMLLMLILLSRPNLNYSDYLVNYKDIHNNYFSNSILIIQIFNSIISVTLIIMLMYLSNSFDILFISNIKRKDLCIVKIIVLTMIISILILFEVFILYLIPLTRYKLFKFNNKELFNIILYLFISIMFEIMIESVCITFIPSIFIPMVIMFFSIVIKFISNIISIYKSLFEIFVPIISFNDITPYMKSSILSFIWIILFMFLYFSIYTFKDIKQN